MGRPFLHAQCTLTGRVYAASQSRLTAVLQLPQLHRYLLPVGRIWQDGEERVVAIGATFVVCHAVFRGCDVPSFLHRSTSYLQGCLGEAKEARVEGTQEEEPKI